MEVVQVRAPPNHVSRRIIESSFERTHPVPVQSAAETRPRPVAIQDSSGNCYPIGIGVLCDGRHHVVTLNVQCSTFVLGVCCEVILQVITLSGRISSDQRVSDRVALLRSSFTTRVCEGNAAGIDLH